MNIRTFFLTAAFLTVILLPAAGFAQGILQGSVTDSTNKEDLVGANILLKKTAIGGISDIDGKFRISNIAAGQYTVRVSYLGYKTKEIDITITDGGTTQITAALLPDVLEGQEVIITAQARGQLSAINQQLKSTTMVNVVSEEKIKELPDANAAEAIGRLPGVSLIRSGGEANKVILRGMSDKFAKVTVDGVGLASTDSNSRGVDLSMMSQGSLSGIELYKALTADRDADAIAGSINLVTKKAPSERIIRADLKGNYNKLKPTYDQYDMGLYYGERFFDDVFGIQLIGNLEKRDRSSEKTNTDWPTENDTDYVLTDFILEYTDETRTRDGVSAYFDIVTPDSGTIRFNNMYSGTKRSFMSHLRDYPNGNSRLIPNGNGVSYIFRDREQELSTYNHSLHGINHLADFDLYWGLSFAQSTASFPHDYELDFSEISTNNSGMKNFPQSLRHGPQEGLIELAYNNFDKAQLNWAFVRNQRNYEKERTAYLDIARKYSVGDLFSGEFKFGGKYKVRNRIKTSSEFAANYYLGGDVWSYILMPDGTRQLKDTSYAGTPFAGMRGRFGNQVILSYFLDSPIGSRNLFEKYRLYPLINRETMQQWYDLNKGDFSGPTGGSSEYRSNAGEIGNYYDITERISAGYLMNTFKAGEEITFIAGVRFEKENNDYFSRYSPDAFGGFPATTEFRDTSSRYTELVTLPNFHLNLKPFEFLNVRFAAYRALARPDFNYRLAKYVATSNNMTLGNPDLKTAKAWNYETNVSIFSNTIGLISLSAFYKEIDDMFHYADGIRVHGNVLHDSLGIVFNNPYASADYELNVPYNSPGPTKVWGFELEHQANLNFLPGYLQFLVVSYNISLVRSETYLLTGVIYTVPETTMTEFGPVIAPKPIRTTKITKNKLENQPEMFGNVGIGYDIADVSVRLSLYYQDEFARIHSTDGKSESLIDSFSRWDLSLKYNATEQVSLLFNINNLTDFVEGTSTKHLYKVKWRLNDVMIKYGLTADMGVRITL
jgi:TonB-dependent receptor